MLKFIGLLFIFFGFSLGGHLLVKRERERIESSEGLLCLIRFVRQNVAFFRIPLSDIYKQFSYPALQKGNFLVHLYQMGLKHAYLSEKERFAHDSFTENRFLSFAETIGKLPLDEQIHSCDLIIELLEEKLRDSKAKYPTQKKLYQVLSISLGIAVIILFL